MEELKMRISIRATAKDQWVKVQDLYSSPPNKEHGPYQLKMGDYSKPCSDAAANCQAVPDLQAFSGRGRILVLYSADNATYMEKDSSIPVGDDQEVDVDKLTPPL